MLCNYTIDSLFVALFIVIVIFFLLNHFNGLSLRPLFAFSFFASLCELRVLCSAFLAFFRLRHAIAEPFFVFEVGHIHHYGFVFRYFPESISAVISVLVVIIATECKVVAMLYVCSERMARMCRSTLEP